MTPNRPTIPPDVQREIEILAFPDLQLLDLAGATQVFAAANEIRCKAAAQAPYRLRVVSPQGRDVRSTSGITLETAALPDEDTPVDTLIVVGGQGVMAAAKNAELLEWLRARAGAARRVASVCTGAFLLAAAGLLDERRVVTHWEYCDRLARLYPRLTVDPNPIFIRDGEFWTSAGVTAGIDLCLALVEDDLGRTLALGVARNLVVFLKRPGGQAQFSAALSLQAADDKFAGLHAWLTGHLGDDLSLRMLAQRAGMSERTFLRRYRETTGLTPQRAVERLRVEAARQFLTETRLTAKRIAARCGFGSEETMRKSFLRLQGTSPQEFRQRFGG